MAAVLAALAATAPLAAAADMPMVAHRAVYDLALDMDSSSILSPTPKGAWSTRSKALPARATRRGCAS